MRKQAEVNSGERLGGLTSPRYLLVPPDLENTARRSASEGMPGMADNDVNPEAAGNTHGAAAHGGASSSSTVDRHEQLGRGGRPALYPTIGLGFRYGETPEMSPSRRRRAG